MTLIHKITLLSHVDLLEALNFAAGQNLLALSKYLFQLLQLLFLLVTFVLFYFSFAIYPSFFPEQLTSRTIFSISKQ